MNNLFMRLREQFEAQYEVADNDCWLWTGPQDRDGYGQMRLLGGMIRAYRFSYELHIGPIPDGLVIDHQCDTRLCVNYRHLETVTNRENILRGNGPSAKNARKTHCLYGHPFDGTNTRVYVGRRYCQECVRIRARKYQTRKRRAAGVPERVIGPRSKKLALSHTGEA